MSSLLIAFFVSFVCTIVVIRSQALHQRFTADLDLSGPQKFHKTAVPRIGGLGIALGMIMAILYHSNLQTFANEELFMLLCAAPVFAIGLLEDLTKKISVRTRLIFTALGGFLSIYFLGTQIIRLDIPGIDLLLLLSPISIVFAVFALTGLANAYNIIDGFNGLSSMVGIITLLALGYISFVVVDPTMMYLSFVMAAAILGFFIWNYPRGLIFLGDGGAYLIGFWISSISVLLVARHENISPWFALMINAYPILETIFTIYRRKIHQGKSPGQPDGIHFHSLIYRRILNTKSTQNKADLFSANARTAPYLWILTTMAVVPAILWWNSSYLLMFATLVFVISYVWLYKRIVCFQTPKWMHH